MDEAVRAYVSRYPEEVQALFLQLRQLIVENAPVEPQETLWAKLPSYSVGGSFVRLIPFRDHINIEARAAVQHRQQLTGWKMTPKGMVQIYVHQDVPCEVLKQIFAETLR